MTSSQDAASVTEPSPYWMSYETHPSELLLGQHTISIILDGGTHAHFSGIRLIVVQNSPNLGFTQHIIEKIEYDNLPYRKILQHQRSFVRESKSLLDQHSSSDGKVILPLCTVVLGLAPGAYHTTLAPWNPATPNSQSRLRILYDRAISCTEDQHCFTAVLQEYSRAVPYQNAFHNIRVLPLGLPRRPMQGLPPMVVKMIGTFISTEWTSGIRPPLLSLALMSKDWLPMLEILYNSIGTNMYPSLEDRGAMVLARCLKRNPDNAKHIINFNCDDYYREGGGTSLRSCKAFLSILKLVKSLENITINKSALHPFLRERFVKAISELKAVRTCMVHGDWEGRPIDVGYIQRFTSQLPELQSLSFTYVGHSDNFYEFKDSREITHRNLRSLEIKSGNLSGVQLLRFISPSKPKLQKLILTDIDGLSNRNLRTFLTHASPTLEYLKIEACHISRDAENEEYALDAVMSKMVALDYTSISGPGLITAAVIGRRPHGPSSTRQLNSGLSSIKIKGAPEIDLDAEGVMRAMDTASWGKVVIFESGWDEQQYNMVCRVASEKNISISEGLSSTFAFLLINKRSTGVQNEPLRES